MSYIPPQLDQVYERLNEGEQNVSSTPRELIGWFGHYRRTWRQVRLVIQALRDLELTTNPDFEGAGFDDVITILKVQSHQENTTSDVTNPPAQTPPTTQPPSTTPIESDAATITPAVTAERKPVDPVHRVSRFLPTGKLVSVARDETLQVAVTQMLLHSYSQLPVMQGERSVFGMISWHSIGRRRAFGNHPEFVRDCIEPHYEVKGDESIFDAIRAIQEHECVLVRSADNRISGILTATDISGSFEQLSRPFLLLSYVENHLRALIHPKFSVAELQSAKDPSDTQRQIADVSDMTFGEYIRLLENPGNWDKLGIGIERGLFVTQLNDVREIRNDVMHFNPEGIEDADMETLRRFNSFLQSIITLLPT